MNIDYNRTQFIQFSGSKSGDTMKTIQYKVHDMELSA